MRLNVHTISVIKHFDYIKSISFQGYTIHENHCDEQWCFDNTQLCIRYINNTIDIIYVYSGAIKISKQDINIYTTQFLLESDLTVHIAKTNQRIGNDIYKDYILYRSNTFLAKNYMRDFFKKLHVK